MKLLLDTHVFLGLIDQTLGARMPKIAGLIAQDGVQLALSVASLWEIAIKIHIGKLTLRVPVEDAADYARSISIAVLPVSERHAVARPVPETSVRDPFDRLLLAVAQLEGMRLVTMDRALAAHPLAARP